MNKFTIFSILISLSAFGFALYLYTAQPNIKYINAREVFDGFDMKKKFEAQLKVTGNAREHILDSLKLNLQIEANKLKSAGKPSPDAVGKFELMQREFQIKERAIMEDNQNQSQQYDQQIWTQLNQYISDYGKEHRIEMIIGAKGDGTVMHADEKLNITKEVIKFANEKYKGVK